MTWVGVRLAFIQQIHRTGELLRHTWTNLAGKEPSFDRRMLATLCVLRAELLSSLAGTAVTFTSGASMVNL